MNWEVNCCRCSIEESVLEELSFKQQEVKTKEINEIDYSSYKCCEEKFVEEKGWRQMRGGEPSMLNGIQNLQTFEQRHEGAFGCFFRVILWVYTINALIDAVLLY